MASKSTILRRGHPIYVSNPSLEGLASKNKLRRSNSKVVNGSKAVLYDESTGEITGEGSVAFMESEVVDSDKFIKLYLAGLDGMFKLTKSAQSVFKLLWMQVQEKKNNDLVQLNMFLANDFGIDIKSRGLTRGIKELLDKEFIFNTSTDGLYFFNAKFMFNGNRIITAKQYVLGKKTESSSPLERKEK